MSAILAACQAVQLCYNLPMKNWMARSLSLLLTLVLTVSQTWATCGGGGGGGTGGMGGGSGAGGSSETYPVPWKVVSAADAAQKSGLTVYWLPSSQQELEKSSLRFSRDLSNYATKCVSMTILDFHTPLGQKYASNGAPPLVVLAAPDGSVVGKLEKNKDGRLNVGDVEKLVSSEVKKREAAIKEKMESAKSQAKAGDNKSAIAEYRAVYDQKCMFPDKAKDAAKELKKLGVNDLAAVPDGPNFDPAVTARIERTMSAGLKAENAGKYTAALRLYQQAHLIDPADPVPLRYVGEIYRHHLADWITARPVFREILNMPAA